MLKVFTSIMTLMIILTGSLSFNAFELPAPFNDEQQATSSDKALNPSEDPSVCKDPHDNPDFHWDTEPDDTVICMPDPQLRKYVNNRWLDKGEVDDAIIYGDVADLSVSSIGLPSNYGITDLTGISALGRRHLGSSFTSFSSEGNDIVSYEPLGYCHSLDRWKLRDTVITPEAFASLSCYAVHDIEIGNSDLSAITPEQFTEVFGSMVEANEVANPMYSIYFTDNNLNTEQLQAIFDVFASTGELTNFAVGEQGTNLGMIDFDMSYDYSELETFNYRGSNEPFDLADFPPMPNLTILDFAEDGITQQTVDENITPEKYPSLRSIALNNDSLDPYDDPVESTTGRDNQGLLNSVYDFTFLEAWGDSANGHPNTTGTARNQVILLDPITVTNLPEAMSYDYNIGAYTGTSKSTEVPLVLGDNHVISSYYDFFYEGATADNTLGGREISGIFIQDVYYQKGPKVTVADYAMDEVEVDSGFTMTDEEIAAAMGYTVVETGSSKVGTTVELSSSPDSVVPLTIDYTAPGSYPVYFFTTNADDMTTVESATFTINDLTPTIDVTTPSITVEEGSAALDLIADFGVTATEISTGDLTSVVVPTSTVDYTTPGTYPVDYTVSDDEGNEATNTAEIIVEAAADPVVTVSDYAMDEVEVDSGFTMTDEEIKTAMAYALTSSGSTVSSDVTVELSSTADSVTPLAIDYTTPGTYPVYFFTTNAAGHTVVSNANFTVNDLLPTIAVTTPSITVQEDSTALDLMTSFGVSATEISSGDLTSAVVPTSTVDYNTPGTYPVDYVVTDDEGNEATNTAEIIVEPAPVVIEAPEVTVTNYVMDEVSTDSGFTMTDEEIATAMEYTVVDSGTETSTDVTLELSSSPDSVVPLTIDYTVPGAYPVYFFASNVDSQTSVTQATFTVTDLLPTIAVTTPVVTVEQDSAALDLIADFGVTATEITESDLTAVIDATSTVDYATVGTYPVTYTVVDDEANEATAAATIIVEAAPGIIEGADFTVDKTAFPVGDGSVDVEIGDEIDYTISMNSNSDIATGITIIDPLSTNLELDEDTVELSLDGTAVESTVEYDETTNTLDVEFDQAISVGDELALTFETTVVDDQDGKVENTATISTNDPSLTTTKETPTTVHNIVPAEEVITDKPSEDNSETEEVVTEDKSEDNTETEEVASEQADDEQMSLATTGAKIAMAVIAAVVVLALLIGTKLYLKTNK